MAGLVTSQDRATAPMGLVTVNRCEPCICYHAGPGPVPHRLAAARPCHWPGGEPAGHGPGGV
jgi:hypothetical protein